VGSNVSALNSSDKKDSFQRSVNIIISFLALLQPTNFMGYLYNHLLRDFCIPEEKSGSESKHEPYLAIFS
jgi:hypothetical protein